MRTQLHCQERVFGPGAHIEGAPGDDGRHVLAEDEDGDGAAGAAQIVLDEELQPAPQPAECRDWIWKRSQSDRYTCMLIQALYTSFVCERENGQRFLNDKTVLVMHILCFVSALAAVNSSRNFTMNDAMPLLTQTLATHHNN